MLSFNYIIATTTTATTAATIQIVAIHTVTVTVMVIATSSSLSSISIIMQYVTSLHQGHFRSMSNGSRSCHIYYFLTATLSQQHQCHIINIPMHHCYITILLSPRSVKVTVQCHVDHCLTVTDSLSTRSLSYKNYCSTIIHFHCVSY